MKRKSTTYFKKYLIRLKIRRYIIKKIYCGRLMLLVIMTNYECE